MKKTLVSLSLSLLLASPTMAERPNYDISDKPPEFKPLPNEFGITVEKAKPQDDEADYEKGMTEKEAKNLERYYGDHNPEDHDHDDPEELDHEHDDPEAHKKQVREAQMKAAEQDIESREERKWWQFW